MREFNKQAAVISKLKMEGQINTPVAKMLLKNVPEGVTAGKGAEMQSADIERKELNELMSLEM